MLGNGVKEDPVEAVNWFLKAAEQEDGNAQFAMGKCYEDGTGVPMNKNRALYWYTKASDNGIRVSDEIWKRLKTK